MSALPDVIALTVDHVRATHAGDSSGHDWWHIERVWRISLQIAIEEGANCYVVQLASLLHDIADWKFHNGDETVGPRVAREWLLQNRVNSSVIESVCDIISRVTFKGSGVPTPMPTLEGKCVQDADRLDAIGAIGVARAFAFGGQFGRAMFDPSKPAILHETFEAYKSNCGPTINHFYEKLLLLKDRMHTSTGRKLACERHQFMEGFLKQFFHEWNAGTAVQSATNASQTTS